MGDPKPRSEDGSSSEPVRRLAERYFTPLVRFFRRRGYAPDAAEDGAQEVFVRMLGLAGDARIDNEEAYLFRVASSVITDRARRDAVRLRSDHDSSEYFDLAGEEPSPERVVSGRQDLRRMKAALDEMPLRRREILMLNRMDGLTYSQLAVRYGVTVSAIEKQMMKAIAHLHARMKDRQDA